MNNFLGGGGGLRGWDGKGHQSSGLFVRDPLPFSFGVILVLGPRGGKK